MKGILELNGRSKTVIFNNVKLEFDSSSKDDVRFYIVSGSLELVGKKFGSDNVVLSEGDFVFLEYDDIKILPIKWESRKQIKGK